MEEQEFFFTTMPSSRPADYYLGYMGGCVFIDFNNYDQDLVYLKRISFDGYGCCRSGDNPIPLNLEDSRSFKAMFQNNLIDHGALLTIVKKAISLNKESIWTDALEAYFLV